MASDMTQIVHGTVPLSHERHLGVCVHVGSNFAKIAPKFILSGDEWTPITDAQTDYPPEGTVFCPGFEMMNAEPESCWEFSVKPNDRLDPDDRHHRSGRRLNEVIAYDVVRAKPVVDLSHHATIEEARQWLVELGIDQPLRAGETVFIKFNGDVWAQMEMEEDEGLWRPAMKVDLENVALWKTSKPAPIAPYDAGFFLPSSFSLETQVRKVDLTTDAMFAKELPRRLRQLLGDVPVDDQDILSGTTDRGRVQVFVKAAEIIPSRHEHLVTFNERLRAFATQLDRNVDIVEEIFRTIRDQPAVAQSIQREVGHLADEARDRIKKDITADVAANWERDNACLVEKRQKLTSELEILDDRNRTAIGKLADTKKKAEAIQRGITDVVDGLRVVLDRAPKRSSERARLIAEHVEKLLGGGRNILIPAELPPWSSGTSIDAKEIGLRDLAGSIETTSKVHGFESSDIMSFDVLVRSGEPVLLAGPDRDAFLSAYASAVTGAMIRRMPLDFGIIGVDDLWRQPGTGQPTAFAHAWVAARSRPDTPVLIVLDEVQATSGWTWISPFNAYLAAEERPRNLLICMTARAPDPDSTEAFGQAVGGLSRMAPKAKEAAAFRAARLQVAAAVPEPRLLTGMGASAFSDLNEADEVVPDFADGAYSIRDTVRAVNILKSAAVTMRRDQAAGMASDFLSFLTRDHREAGTFVKLSEYFDAECGISQFRSPGESHA